MIMLKDLTLYIKDSTIVNNLNLNVNKASLLLITGGVGSGKTTLLKALAGIAQIMYKNIVKIEGSIKLINDISPERALELGLISYIPQEPYAYFIGSSVDEEMMLLDKLIADNFMHVIKDLKGRKISELSAGELYRLLTILSITKKTRYLMIDEPSSYLDPESLNIFLDHINNLINLFNVAVVIADHADQLYKAELHIKLKRHDEDVVSSITEFIIDCFESCYPSRDYAYLKIKNLGYKLNNNLWLITDLTLHAYSGDIICITGPNGTGKTTFIKILAGILKPSSGYIEKRGKIFYVPQIPIKFFVYSSVLEELSHFLTQFNSWCRNKLLDAIARYFKLDTLLGRNPFSLSVGEARRLGMALALLSKPDILLIDEISLGADYITMNMMRSALRYISTKGTLIVLTSHNEKIIKDLNLCSEVIIFGRKREDKG